MKGIILAGGSATRLRPASLALTKHLMPVYDKPLIYYPITTLMLSGIQEILLISNPIDLPKYKKLFSNSEKWGLRLEYAEQSHPGGIAEAIIIGEKFIGADSVCLILGDNLFHGLGLGRQIRDSFTNFGALICAYQVSNPKAFGVVEFDTSGSAISLEEKPLHPKSSWAVPGLYFYDNSVISKAKKLSRSPRGELEITDLNKKYMLEGNLKVKKMPRGTTWLDMGTPASLLDAAQYVKVMQDRQGILIGSPEEASWRNGWISTLDLRELAQEFPGTDYGRHLIEIENEENL